MIRIRVDTCHQRWLTYSQGYTTWRTCYADWANAMPLDRDYKSGTQPTPSGYQRRSTPSPIDSTLYLLQVSHQQQ